MTFGASAYTVALLAGILTTLSPCVLPLVPILMGSALSAHRLGPLALAGGVALSFAATGALLATAGASLGLDAETLRPFGASLLILFGVILLSSRLQGLFARVTAGLTSSGNALLSRLSPEGMGGQLLLGLILGLVWSPCVGPTLGAATTLASQGKNLAETSLLMGIFGVGASLPMILIGALSRTALQGIRGSLNATARYGKQALGVLLLLLGGLILSHADHRLEAWLLDHSPAWLTELTTHY